MDLRSIVNNDENTSDALARPSSMRATSSQTPVTPVQSSNATFEPAPSSAHAASTRYSSQDYRQSQHVSPNIYSSTSHHTSGQPLLHQTPSHLQSDGRSPITSQYHSQGDTQSLRRHTPTGSVSTLSSGYPPPQNGIATPGSPSQPYPPQHHQYQQHHQQQHHQQQQQQHHHQPHHHPNPNVHADSYSPAATNYFPPPPASLTHQTSHSSYGQPSPQTPNTSIIANTPYQNQYHRAQSAQSNSTPNSAHAQLPPYSSYAQQPHTHLYESPRSSHNYPGQHQPPLQHSRQQSQPGTPLGPPSLPRQASDSYQQSTSPRLQRYSSSAQSNSYVQTRASPAHTQPPATSYSQPRLPSAASLYSSHRGSLDERVSFSSRERSTSVSPKTRVDYLPRIDTTPQPPFLPPAQHHQQQYQESPLFTPHEAQQQPPPPPPPAVERPSTNNPAMPHSNKRKLDDRGSSEPVPAVPKPQKDSRTGESNVSQQPPTKKQRTRYTAPPIWAQSILAHKTSSSKVQPGPSARTAPADKINGSGPAHNAPSTTKPAATPVTGSRVAAATSKVLGPWEPSLSGKTPFQQLTKHVADWFFTSVVLRPDHHELKARGVEIEIEAKLGTLIDHDTQQRIHYPIDTECIISADRNRMTFKSSMTESQHKFMNDFLNSAVKDAHPENPVAAQLGRVPIIYKHRRERDSFYELPPSQFNHLPSSIRESLKRNKGVKVRVTRDQKTGQVLAKIIKARISDVHMYMPKEPLDCRISINLEMRYDGDIEELTSIVQTDPQPERHKDRLSYQHGCYTVDLTQVTIQDTREHELELELNTAALIRQGQLAQMGEDHRFPELVDGFVDNIRLLARNVPC